LPDATTEIASPPEQTGSRPRLVLGIRFRLAVLILVMQVLLIWWVADSEIIRGVYLVCYTLMMPTVMYLLFVRAIRRWLPFRDNELLFCYIVLTCTIPAIGFGGLRFLIAGMGYLRFFSKTQPAWTAYLPYHDRLPVLNDTYAATKLYTGGVAVPWHAWVVPIAYWSLYLLLLAGIWICLAGVLRRVWIHQERLPFPIAVLPLQLMDKRENIMRSPLLWIGFALPAIFQSLLVFHNWWPAVPAVQMKAYYLNFTAPPWNASPGFAIGVYPMALGLAYFVPSDVSLSCWLLAVLMKFVYIGGAAVGLQTAESRGLGFPWAEEQAAGAWIGLAGVVLWGARHQWKTVAKLVPPDEIQAANRLARAAVLCALLCAVMTAAVGIPALASVGMVLVYIAYVIAGARVRAEAGGQWTFAPVVQIPHRVAYAVFGTHGMAEGAFAASGYLSLLHVDIRAQSLPYLMEGMDIAERGGIRWRTVLIWVGVGTATALAIGWCASLTKYYAVGAAMAKANHYPLVKANIAFTEVARLMNASRNPDIPSVLAMAGGAGITIALASMRKIGLFGLHPVGYVMCNTLIMGAFIVPFFAAWLAKTVVLKFGGGNAYRRSVPFFVGIILGDVVIQGFWALYGWVFGVPIYQFLS
jgi:hypothetical protein